MQPGLFKKVAFQKNGRLLKLKALNVLPNGHVKEGFLQEETGLFQVPICQFIPRFVKGANYTESFGKQWLRYRDVQIDSENQFQVTQNRFYRWTAWQPTELNGKKILEAGCGAGRFTQVMLNAGAYVYAFDLSDAVDACFQTNRFHPGLCLFQADLYDIALEPGQFDYVFCYGVLQHTPDPEKAFLSMVRFLRPGGKISIDCYIKSPRFSRWSAKYKWRFLTTRISSKILFRFLERFIPLWLPIDNWLSKNSVIGKVVTSFIPCWNYKGLLPLTDSQITKWAVLDTFDALASTYDKPQRIETIQSWFEKAGLVDIKVTKGSNGIVGNGIKP